MSNTVNILQGFEAITLAEMDAVALMDRKETKYAFSAALLPEILESLQAQYRVLEINGKRISAYKSLYYDTPGFELYHMHHNGRLNRYKVRHREYADSGDTYFEIKFKTNRGRTRKTRTAAPLENLSTENKAGSFLCRKSPYTPEQLLPVIWVNYSRITLVSRDRPERLTLDTNLHFEWEGKRWNLPSLVIAEVKQEGKQYSAFTEQMKNRQIRSGSLSKYCMATALTGKDVKVNRFKHYLLKLKPYVHAQ